ncbi:MAG: alpha/beta hydrolase [Clostridia bacterium]|nr:alpha/beta hydrolase [Clostridia bacterium]
MKEEIIHLFKDKPEVYLKAYETPFADPFADALLILPGGGYGFVSMDREGDPMAVAFSALGFRTFVLNYSVLEGARFPAPLVEASVAMHYIKANAKKYGIDPERVFVLGFSAGGHLAASLGTLWRRVWREEKLDMPEGANRPAGMILSYPVISWFEGTHKGTFYHAMGREDFTEEEIAAISLDQQVSEETCPAFLWHTADDPGVSVENSLKMASALAKAGIYHEMHIFPHGGHGLATATRVTVGVAESDPRIARWPALAAEWMKTVK